MAKTPSKKQVKPAKAQKPAGWATVRQAVQQQEQVKEDDQGRTQREIQHLAKLIEKFKIAMLTTEQPDGSLRSRPMITQKSPFDGTLWFLSARNAPKIGEIQGHTQVNVVYADPDASTYISVSGKASLVEDRALIVEHWHDTHMSIFPGGPDNPNLVLLRIDVEQAEYWDDHKLMILLGTARARLTGDIYKGEGTEHGRLSLSLR